MKTKTRIIGLVICSLSACIIGFYMGIQIVDKDNIIKRMKKDSIDAHHVYLLQNSMLQKADTIHNNCIVIH